MKCVTRTKASPYEQESYVALSLLSIKSVTWDLHQFLHLRKYRKYSTLYSLILVILARRIIRHLPIYGNREKHKGSWWHTNTKVSVLSWVTDVNFSFPILKYYTGWAIAAKHIRTAQSLFVWFLLSGVFRETLRRLESFFFCVKTLSKREYRPVRCCILHDRS